MAYPAKVIRQKFEKRFKIAESGCWEWQSGLWDGYGRFSFNKRKEKAHRYVGNKRFYGPKQVKTGRAWGIM